MRIEEKDYTKSFELKTWLRLGRFMKPYKWAFITVFALNIFGALIDICLPLFQRYAINTFVVGDMPFGSYQTSDEEAARNAIRFLKEGGVDAIKLEGGKTVASRIRAIRNCGILVFGHIGLTPQSSGVLGGHKAQGRTVESARAVLEDALAVQEAGANFLLVEAVNSVCFLDCRLLFCGSLWPWLFPADLDHLQE